MFCYALEDARHVKRAIELFRDKQLCFCNDQGGTVDIGYVFKNPTIIWC